MVTRLDRDVGRMMRLIDALGLARDTVFIFTSDNGPLYDRLGGTDSGFFNSAGGLNGRKGSLLEGGIRVPCVVRWSGHIAPAQTSERVTGFEDWLPTVLELAGASQQIPRSIDGISFAPTLLGRRQKERPFLYREFPGYRGWQMVMAQDWKLVRRQLQPLPKRTSQPETALYHLAKDPSETHNLAAQQPRKLRQLQRLLEKQHTPSAAFPFPALD
jgi:arylsulfatase